MALLTPVVMPAEPTAFAIESDAGFRLAADGDTFVNDGRTGVYIKNTTGSSKTVTVVAPRKCNNGFNHSAAVVVPTGFAGFIATELEPGRFNNDQGVVALTYSATGAGLSVAAVRLP